jgi:hypothetical protein
MDEATRIIVDRRLAELERGFEISDKNVSRVIQIIRLKAPGATAESLKLKADIVKKNAEHVKIRSEMIKKLRESVNN